MRAGRYLMGIVAFLVALSAWPCGEKLGAMSGGVRYDRIKQVKVTGRVLIFAPDRSELRLAVDEMELAGKLERAGVHVHVVAQRGDIDREFKEHDFDLVLTDVSSVVDLDAGSGRATVLPVSYDMNATTTGDGRCVVRLNKRSSRQFVRVVEMVLEKRSRGVNFDCSAESPTERV